MDQQQEQRAVSQFQKLQVDQSAGVPILSGIISDADADMLRRLTDRFRSEYPSGVAVLASTVEMRPIIIASVSEDLVQRGLHAGELVKVVAKKVGGGGGGKATLAQAGGQFPEKLPEAIALAPEWVRTHIQE
jgi:alanyl-tRNA synthetase